MVYVITATDKRTEKTFYIYYWFWGILILSTYGLKVFILFFLPSSLSAAVNNGEVSSLWD